MYCEKCGAPKGAGDEFCRKCGNQFSKKLIEEIKDDYQINVGVSTILGLCTGIITGIFSAALTQSIQLPWWGWVIALVVIVIFIAFLIFNGFSALKQSLDRRLQRK